MIIFIVMADAHHEVPRRDAHQEHVRVGEPLAAHVEPHEALNHELIARPKLSELGEGVEEAAGETRQQVAVVGGEGERNLWPRQ